MARNRYEFTNDPSISSKFSAYVQRIRKMTFFESSAHRIEMENFFVIFVFSNSVVVIVVVECNNIFFFRFWGMGHCDDCRRFPSPAAPRFLSHSRLCSEGKEPKLKGKEGGGGYITSATLLHHFLSFYFTFSLQ